MATMLWPLFFLRLVWRGGPAVLLALLLWLWPWKAARGEGGGASCAQRLVASPLKRLNPVVLEELLPRPLPTCFQEAELEELERRLWSLGLFDEVKVSVSEDALALVLREKWTLIPGIDLATARTLRDGYYLGSLTEFSFLGRAAELGAYVMYAERSLSGEIYLAEHVQNARRVSWEGGVFSVGSSFLFGSYDTAWSARRTGGRLGLRPPFSYGSPLQMLFSLEAYQERSAGQLPGALARAGVGLEPSVRLTVDAFQWHDVAPQGLQINLEGSPGVFFPTAGGDATDPRLSASLQVYGAIRLGERAALMINGVVEGANEGHPNHSVLLGSVPQYRSFGQIGGVRGLRDNWYRNSFHAFTNLEARYALELRSRWFLQGVAFLDGGTLAPMNRQGERTALLPALSSGVGLRLIPTALTAVTPRVDVGRSWEPERSWFLKVALSQYF
ncbi:MAG: hypothetical protein MUF64_32610 [Polyangiaceae bacterium]|nr:hypothetical protein [Polyangiaceae bacterium]